MTQSLPDFIAEIGDEPAAVLFDAKVRTIQSWRRRERLPRPEQAQAIVRATNGRVTLDGIYTPRPSSPLEEDPDPDAGRIARPVETA